MKKLILGLFLCASTMAHASVGIDIMAGDLKANSTGSVALPTGSLLLLVAAGVDGNFMTSLQPGQFVAGDDTILAAFAADNDGGGNNATYENITLASVTGIIGQKLSLRWFPSIMYSNYGTTTPAAGSYFGAFAGPTSGDSGTIMGGDAWVLPAEGSNMMLNFATASLSSALGADLPDAQPDSAGYANIQVQGVPEPSTYALLSLGLGFAGWMARRKKA